jgi:VIT1/CCC1 family predicted Fe2+/Mn2+ transporter
MPLRRQVPASEETQFGLVRVYVDDIERMVSILNDAASNVSITADGYSADSPTDLLEMESKFIDELVLKTSDPEIELILSQRRASISRVDPGMTTQGAVALIADYVNRHNRRLVGLIFGRFSSSRFFYYTPINIVAAFLALFVGGLLGLNLSQPIWRGLALASIVLSLLLFMTVGLYLSSAFFRVAIVIPKLRRDTPTFWQRIGSKYLLI